MIILRHCGAREDVVGALNGFRRREAWPSLCRGWIVYMHGDGVGMDHSETLGGSELGVSGKMERCGHFEAT